MKTTINGDLFCHQDEPEKPYRIGVFSQMDHITMRALHHYDEVGLLKPTYVDENSRYRYYVSNQLPPLHKILALRGMRFSLERIRQVRNGTSQEQLLKKRKQQLLKIIVEIGEKLARVGGYLSGGYLDDEYRVILKSLPAIIIASMRARLGNCADLFCKMPGTGLEVEKADYERKEPEYCFIMYYDDGYQEQNVDAKTCRMAIKIKEGRGDLEFHELLAVELAACVIHKGAYRTLPLAYRAIVSFIEDNGYEMIGHQREIYVDGIWSKGNEDD